MAFSTQERDALLELKQQGYSLDDALGFIASNRLGNSSRVERDMSAKEEPNQPSDPISDIKRGFGEAVTAVDEGVDRVDAIKSQDRNAVSSAFGQFAGGVRTAGAAIGSLAGGAIRAIPGGTTVMDAVDKTVSKAVTKAEPNISAAKAAFDKLPQGIKQPLGDIGNLAMGAVELGAALTAPGATRVVSGALKKGLSEFAEAGVKELGEQGIKQSINLGISPENLMQRVARISKGKQAAFEERAGESVGEYLVNRGMFGDPESLADQLYSRMRLSKGRVDAGLASVSGVYKNDSVQDAIEQLVEREGRVSSTRTPSKDQKRVTELFNKHNKDGLTLEEVNEVKRLYERNVRVDYLNDRVSDKIAQATNIDTALREFVEKEASKAGIKSIGALNKETSLAKQLLDDLGAEYAGQQGNNLISLSDAFFLAEAASNPTALAAFGLKKVFSSKSAMSAVARLISDKKVRKGLPTVEKQGVLSLPAPKAGSANVSINAATPLPEKSVSSLDRAERVNPNIKTPEGSPQSSASENLMQLQAETTEEIRTSMLELSEAGLKNNPDGSMSRYTTFPQWVPSELRSKDLFTRVWKHIDEGTNPSPNATKEIELLARTREEIVASTMAKESNAFLDANDIPFSVLLAVGATGAAYYFGDESGMMPLAVAGTLFAMPKGERLRLINQQITSINKAIDKNVASGASWSDKAVKDLTKAKNRLAKERDSL